MRFLANENVPFDRSRSRFAAMATTLLGFERTRQEAKTPTFSSEQFRGSHSSDIRQGFRRACIPVRPAQTCGITVSFAVKAASSVATGTGGQCRYDHAATWAGKFSVVEPRANSRSTAAAVRSPDNPPSTLKIKHQTAPILDEGRHK